MSEVLVELEHVGVAFDKQRRVVLERPEALAADVALLVERDADVLELDEHFAHVASFG